MATIERELADHEPRLVRGVQGMASKPFSKRFPHAGAMDKWLASDAAGNCSIERIERA